MKKVYSHSRRSSLAKCARQYFLDVYAVDVTDKPSEFQRGLFDEPEIEHESMDAALVSHVREMKQLTNAFQQAGVILHTLIGQEWQHPDWSPQWFVDQAARRFDDTVKRSMNRVEGSVVLLEHYYELPDTDRTIADARERLARAMSNYINDTHVRNFLNELRNSDQVFAEQSIGGLPQIRDLTVMGRIDLVCLQGDQVRVVDWKMGTAVGDRDSLQLSLYGMWACKKYSVNPECVSIQRVFLADPHVESPINLSARSLDRAHVRLLQDAALMEELHQYGVDGVIDAFPQCDKERVCHQCKYQGLCLPVISATA